MVSNVYIRHGDSNAVPTSGDVLADVNRRLARWQRHLAAGTAGLIASG